ncbi:hypothetical protein [Natronorubrum sulfidifaciens]|uniref:Uncharacterized protein n=1 Tax=Natronorubrum sulfidifaciens JCM 14089 TaxID=1230460 RepID=L9WE85_9EURY|nr:hypothetical protein [Natronorubrum sulfidifaciens]ELY47566.1 hypothetical protein C495_04882 [Natronorubrum sulfidifaciens JCM 14089]
MDPVPTRAERIAALLAILAVVLLVPAAALGSGIAVVVLLFVAFTCGTIAKARTGLDGLRTFGLHPVSDDDPKAERYRERRNRHDEWVQEAVSFDYDPRLDRLLAVGLAVVGVGALVVVVTSGDGGRNTTRLLVIALISLNCALIAYGASYMNGDDRAE